MKREATATAFVSSLLESMTFLARRLVSSNPAEEPLISAEDAGNKALALVDTQIRKVWQELIDGNLKVPETNLAKSFSKALAYLQRVKAGMSLYLPLNSSIRP